ncbi:MAG: WG repeat-containing protein [Eubacterium sp.]|nr:WG repeat-containing protein [Eubacterium sp.]
MKKLFPAALILCMVAAWAVFLTRNIGGEEVYEEYYANAVAAYEQEYYMEALEWLSRLEAAEEEAVPAYEAEALKRDAYLGMGENDAYLGQCFEMIEAYPEVEENYVLVIECYEQQGDLRKLYQYLPVYAQLWQENEEFAWLIDETDRQYEYRNTGYYDVRHATESLLDIQRIEFSLTEDGGHLVERKLCRSNGDEVFDQGYIRMEVSQAGNSCFVCDAEGKWKLVDISDHLLARNREVSFDEVGRLSAENIAKARIGENYQFINDKMKVSELVWEDAGTFHEGVNAVKKNGGWALVTAESWTSVAEFPYSDIARNSLDACCTGGICVVANQSGYYLVDSAEWQPVSENRYEELKAFECDQPTAYRSGDKWGFVNRHGEVYIEARFEDAKSFRNGYAAVKQNGLWGYIDRNGKMVVEPQFQDALYMMPDGIAYVKNEMGYWDCIRMEKLYYESQQE